MNLGKILDKVGGALDSPIGQALQMFVPGVGALDQVLDVVRHGTGKTIDESTPVRDVVAAVDELSPQERTELRGQEIELAIAESGNYAAVAIAQEQNNNATRPRIARDQSAFVIEVGKASFLLIAIAIGVDGWLVYHSKDAFALELVMKGLPWFAGVFVAQAFGVIQQYFARRSDDKRTAMAGAGVQPPPGAGIIQQLGSLFGRK